MHADMSNTNKYYCIINIEKIRQREREQNWLLWKHIFLKTSLYNRLHAVLDKDGKINYRIRSDVQNRHIRCWIQAERITMHRNEIQYI